MSALGQLDSVRMRPVAANLALASPYADDSWHQLRLLFLNRLQEEPLEVGRGVAFVLRLFWPFGYEAVAALP